MNNIVCAMQYLFNIILVHNITIQIAVDISLYFVFLPKVIPLSITGINFLFITIITLKCFS